MDDMMPAVPPNPNEALERKIGALHQMLDARLTALIDQLDMLTRQISKLSERPQ